MNACWLWRGAPLDRVTGIEAVVGSIPYNFALGSAIPNPTFRTPATPEGELEIRQDDCNGPVVARLPLAPADGRAGVTTLSGRLTAAPGRHDLCATFTQKGPEPLWVLDRLTLKVAQ